MFCILVKKHELIVRDFRKRKQNHTVLKKIVSSMSSSEAFAFYSSIGFLSDDTEPLFYPLCKCSVLF